MRRGGFLQVGVGQLELRDKISWSQNLLKAGLGVRGVAGVPVRKSENWKIRSQLLFTYRRLPEKKNIEGRLSLRNHNLIHGEKEFAEMESKQKVQESDEITDSQDV